jgi:hypothetical protein
MAAFYKKYGITIALTVFVVLAFLCVYLVRDTVKIGASALAENYSAAYASEKVTAYDEKYKGYFDAAEKEYHVRNEVSIYIGDLKEEEKLEVLKVRDVEFIIEDKGDNSGNMVSWLEVPGEGTFVVDIKASEFIIDNERHYVLVRVPYPELTNVMIDYAKVNKLLFKDKLFNGNYREGEELAKQQLNKADLLIKKEFKSNQNFFLSAQEAEKSMICNLVKQLNPDVPGLTVIVEYME